MIIPCVLGFIYCDNMYLDLDAAKAHRNKCREKVEKEEARRSQMLSPNASMVSQEVVQPFSDRSHLTDNSEMIVPGS